MTRFFAFLRGINVGGHKVTMDRLRKEFETLGLADVSTFIASGNVVFEADDGDGAALERRIERHLADTLGYEVPTFLRTGKELSRIAKHNPFADSDGGTLFVAFLDRPA